MPERDARFLVLWQALGSCGAQKLFLSMCETVMKQLQWRDKDDLDTLTECFKVRTMHFSLASMRCAYCSMKCAYLSPATGLYG